MRPRAAAAVKLPFTIAAPEPVQSLPKSEPYSSPDADSGAAGERRDRGYISHEYTDHVSILKFIERNWRLPPVTHRSRDNFPNPVQRQDSYAPKNSPALGDLFDFFDFGSGHRD